MKRLIILAATIALTLVPVTQAQYDSGSDGSDGALNIAANTVIDLGLAINGDALTTPGTGNGVYDAARWVVCFKYSTIDIAAGKVVTFTNHPRGAPVVWLTTGNVTISGTVDLNGKNGGTYLSLPSFAAPGPGGFHGGRRSSYYNGFPPSPGYGPGGGQSALCVSGSAAGGGGGHGGNGATNGSPCDGPGGTYYGSSRVLPLIGGSGGGASYVWNEGNSGAGAGGGAILIASGGSISLGATGLIRAIGGDAAPSNTSAGGSGGVIRLIADTINGAGALRAGGGLGSQQNNGGVGYIRVEAVNQALADGGYPSWSFGPPSVVFPPSNWPTLRATLVDAAPVPLDPVAGPETTDLEINNGGTVTINIEATNIPAGTIVKVHLIPANANRLVVDSTPLVAGGGGILTATATATLPPGRTEIQLKSNW